MRQHRPRQTCIARPSKPQRIASSAICSRVIKGYIISQSLFPEYRSFAEQVFLEDAYSSKHLLRSFTPDTQSAARNQHIRTPPKREPIFTGDLRAKIMSYSKNGAETQFPTFQPHLLARPKGLEPPTFRTGI